MKIISIILARGGSKGIPNKNIINIFGKPLILWTIEQSLACDLISKTYVSSDSAEILSIADKYGAIPIERPNYLSTDTSTSESALLHAIDTIEDADIIVFLQPTSPIRKNNDIKNAILKFINDKHDSLFSASILPDYCIWEHDKNNNLISINFDFKNRKRRQDSEIQYLENGSIYIFDKEVLLKYNNRLGGNIGIYIMKHWQSYEIDSYEDIGIVEFYLKKLFI